MAFDEWNMFVACSLFTVIIGKLNLSVFHTIRENLHVRGTLQNNNIRHAIINFFFVSHRDILCKYYCASMCTKIKYHRNVWYGKTPTQNYRKHPNPVERYRSVTVYYETASFRQFDFSRLLTGLCCECYRDKPKYLRHFFFVEFQ